MGVPASQSPVWLARLSLSGYAGNSFSNTLSANRTGADRYKDVKGTVMIGAFDFLYDAHNWIVRGNSLRLRAPDQFGQDFPVQPRYAQRIALAQAICGFGRHRHGVEAGYDIFSQIRKLKERGTPLYVFGRYEFYDSMFDTAKSVIRQDWCGRQRVQPSGSLLSDQNIVIKVGTAHGLLGRTTIPTPPPGRPARASFNNEPSLFAGDRLFRLFQTLTKS